MPKFYVVWVGHKPGIYNSWEQAKEQVNKFPNAKYKAFPTYEQALQAFNEGFEKYISTSAKKLPKQTQLISIPKPKPPYIAVDAACSGNPGPVEYQGLLITNNKTIKLFKIGPIPNGTNNIGEFLAIVHALALCKQNGWNYPIYSDSQTALTWVKNKHCATKLDLPQNSKIFDLITRAQNWLLNNKFQNQLLKWDTNSWGEIPADFGRK